MARSLSTIMKQAINAQETGECPLILLTIDHADLPAPIRVCNNGADIVSNSETYLAFPFEIDLPGDDDEKIQSVRLAISNVDRQIVQAVRSISGPPTVTLDVALASQPDTLEVSGLSFFLRNVSYDALIVEGELRFEDTLSQGFPQHVFDPQNFPGMH